VKRILPFGDVEIFNANQKIESSPTFNWVLSGTLDLPIVNLILLEKLSSVIAACSARAVVPPFYTLSHRSASQLISGFICFTNSSSMFGPSTPNAF
jgi:hypothetical protein